MRHLMFNSAWLSKIVLPQCLPFSKLFLLRLLVFTIVHILAYFLSCFILCFGVHESLPHFVSRWPPGNWRSVIHVRLVEPHMFCGSRTRLSVQLHHKHALPPVHPNPLASARVLYVRFLQSEQDDDSLVDSRTHGGQRSLDVSVQYLHVALLAVPNELKSRISFHTYRTTACCRNLTVLLSDPSHARGDSRINGDPQDLVHHVNCVHLLNLQSTFRTLKLVASTRTRHVIRSLLSVARFSLRTLDENVITIFTNFIVPHHVDLCVPSAWIGTPGGLCLLPPHARRSTLLRLLHTPLTQVVLHFFGSRLFLLDASDSPSTLCRRVCGATARPALSMVSPAFRFS